MREFKFRAWDRFGEAMITVNSVNSAYMADDWITGRGPDNSRQVLAGNDEYRLMQSTGLKDSKGVDIYEGDVVSFLRPTFALRPKDVRIREVGVIKWSSSGAAFKAAAVGYAGDYPFPIEGGVEVIGNKFENPELIPP